MAQKPPCIKIKSPTKRDFYLFGTKNAPKMPILQFLVKLTCKLILDVTVLKHANLIMDEFQLIQEKEPLTSAALLTLLFAGTTNYLVLEELSLVPVELVVPVVPVVPVVVFFFVEESPPTIPPSTRTGVNDVAI